MASRSTELAADDANIIRGTDNVFADLGYADANERQTKLRLAYALNRREAPAVIPPDTSPQDPYVAWQRSHRLTPRLREILTASAASLGATGPRFLLLVNTHDCTAEQVDALAASLIAQVYPHWSACFVGRARCNKRDRDCCVAPDLSIKNTQARAVSRTKSEHFLRRWRSRAWREGLTGADTR